MQGRATSHPSVPKNYGETQQDCKQRDKPEIEQKPGGRGRERCDALFAGWEPVPSSGPASPAAEVRHTTAHATREERGLSPPLQPGRKLGSIPREVVGQRPNKGLKVLNRRARGGGGGVTHHSGTVAAGSKRSRKIAQVLVQFLISRARVAFGTVCRKTERYLRGRTLLRDSEADGMEPRGGRDGARSANGVVGRGRFHPRVAYNRYLDTCSTVMPESFPGYHALPYLLALRGLCDELRQGPPGGNLSRERRHAPVSHHTYAKAKPLNNKKKIGP